MYRAHKPTPTPTMIRRICRTTRVWDSGVGALSKDDTAIGLSDRLRLIGSFLERERGFERAQVRFAGDQLLALAGGAARVQIEQLSGGVVNTLRSFALRLFPSVGAELV